jgi:hypothetical protein
MSGLSYDGNFAFSSSKRYSSCEMPKNTASRPKLKAKLSHAQRRVKKVTRAANKSRRSAKNQ